MRKNGRPWSWRFRLVRGVINIPSVLSYGTGDGYVVRCSRCSVGVILTCTHFFSGRLVRQSVFRWEDWVSLSTVVRKGIFMGFFVRPDKAKAPVGGGDAGGVDVVLAKECPTLACYLGSDTWPDGEVRQRSTLIVFFEEGSYKACLSDKDTNMTLWAAAKTLEGLPEALEARLTDDSPDWRKQRPQKKRT